MTLAKALRKAARYVLDTLAPPDPEVRAVEDMTLSMLRDVVSTRGHIERVDGVRAFLPYRTDEVRKALVELKMYKNVRIVKLFAALTYEHLVEELSDLMLFENFSDPLLVPIPMTGRDRRKRGWNQCELLARELSRLDRDAFVEPRYDALEKTRQTDDQVGKGRAERRDNLASCFGVADESAVRGRNMGVIDDIVTRGSPLVEERRALLHAGARAVLCVAVAY